MPLGTIGRMMNATRRTMITSQAIDAAEQFDNAFGLKTGDFIEAEFCCTSDAMHWKVCRIAEVGKCFFNSFGGYTARVKVIPLNLDGGLGCTRKLILTIDKKGKLGKFGTGGIRRHVPAMA